MPLCSECFVWFFLGSGGWVKRLLRHWSALARTLTLYMRACDSCSHALYGWELLGETSALLPCSVQPFMLARSGGGSQKETSAHWENALIIHDHLTIQDLVWAAYVAFHISAATGLPHLFAFFSAALIVVYCFLSTHIAAKPIIVLVGAVS